jgi:flagellar motility protein MotE (MotC chaperone)
LISLNFLNSLSAKEAAMHLIHSDPRQGWKFLNAMLVCGLLLKIVVSAVYLAPLALWAWPGPTVSEAATHAVAKPESPSSLPRLFTLMHKERQSLQAREAAVAGKEEQLRTLQKEVEERLQELKALQLKMMETIEEEKRIKGDHNRHLVATLTAMPPDRAARLLEKMEEDVAVQLLRNIKGKEAGAILAMLAPDKAARLSQRLLQ